MSGAAGLTPGSSNKPTKAALTRRALLVGGAGLALWADPTRNRHLDPPGPSAGSSGSVILDDASRLNATPMVRHWMPTVARGEGYVADLRAALKRAKDEGRPVVLGGARHSMGGQSLAYDGVAITPQDRSVEVDPKARIARLAGGARWGDAIAALDPLGLSPKVMQSNNDFCATSTFCVNSHGWPAPHGPFCSTVRAATLMLADGSVVECSPTREADLFAHAAGGYGLFGVVLEVELDVVPNQMLVPTIERMPAVEFAARYVAAVEQPGTEMAVGRLSVARHALFDEAIMAVYRPAPIQPATLPGPDVPGFLIDIEREIYRLQDGSEWAKSLRWGIESRLMPALVSPTFTRNALLNQPVSHLGRGAQDKTDILHEYFLPPDAFGRFIEACREIIPPARAELLNVTLRYVAADPLSKLAYAPAARIAAVMSFSQDMGGGGEADMIQLTQRLIGAALGCNGSFYLPYRLHAHRDAVRMAYPDADAFGRRKRELDPDGLFRNAMWNAYFA